MAKIERFEDLEVWQNAGQPHAVVFRLFRDGDASRDFSLKNQVLRSSGSIMDNIAEGFERSGNKEFVQFLAISKGSCGELRSQLYRSLDREYISGEQFQIISNQCIDLSKQIGGFMNYLKNSEMRGSKYA